MENQTTTGSSAELRNLTDQIEEGIRSGKYTWRDIQHACVAKTRDAAANTDLYVHENPWQVVGIAAGLGFILGLLLAPGSSDE